MITRLKNKIFPTKILKKKKLFRVWAYKRPLTLKNRTVSFGENLNGD